jgi:peroxiredoxin
MGNISRAISLVGLTFAICFAAAAQSADPARPVSKTIFYDSDGNLITNNEFVDIRMANFHMPDRTLMRTIENGTVEFRLQKVPQEGMQLPDFELRTIDGKTISTADLKGKVAVINFWFIGCPVCLAQKPRLNDLAAKFGGQSDLVFLAMTSDSFGDVKRFVQKERFDYVQTAEALPAMERFGFVGYPKNMVVSRTGEVVYWRSTIKAWEKFESVIRTELAK